MDDPDTRSSGDLALFILRAFIKGIFEASTGPVLHVDLVYSKVSIPEHSDIIFHNYKSTPKIH